MKVDIMNDSDNSIWALDHVPLWTIDGGSGFQRWRGFGLEQLFIERFTKNTFIYQKMRHWNLST